MTKSRVWVDLTALDNSFAFGITEYDEEAMSNVCLWCEANCQGEFEVYNTMVFFFSDEDVVMFKLAHDVV